MTFLRSYKALVSIIVLQSLCLYSVFTNIEWQRIISQNPYASTDPLLPMEVSTSLHSASTDFLQDKDVYLNPTNSDISHLAIQIFNAMQFFWKLSQTLPAIIPNRMLEEEYCYQILYSVLHLIFIDVNRKYALYLNHATKDKAERPIFTYIVSNTISLLNSETKLPGFTILQQNKDRLKLLKTKGSPYESVLFTNTSISDQDSTDMMYISWVARDYCYLKVILSSHIS
ncbi:hypothetical protein BC938DRAFT_474491 [Jimgerdemannia flammicorona]|uniref:Uncharacterized protein n=1 Tax=Jimgerdemannia flammicorona TaxID=994334 RepID=A0A433QSH2_9FUNG|nr:hypothetical protein BC938DRAFT_474491 [Jimgerdemannia flammicorona]